MHTHRRAGVYTYRRRIPLDLVAALGRNEVTFSLRTKNRPEAMRLAARETVRLDAEWSALRAKVRAGMPREWPADYDFVEVAAKLHPVPPPRGGWPKPEAISAEELARQEQSEYEHQLEAEEDEQAAATTHAILEQAIAVLRDHGWAPPAAAPNAQRVAGEQTSRETLDDMLKHWKRAKERAPKTVDSYGRAVLAFNMLHRDPPVTAITRRMVVAYRDKLQDDGLKVKTVNDRLSVLRALLAVAIDRGAIETNVAADAGLPREARAVESTMPYTADQARQVLDGTAGMRETRPAGYWLPRLGLWTGARLNELHQLRKEDCTERDGVRGLRITDQGDCLPPRVGKGGEVLPPLAMRLKNAASRRWVPLHSEVADFWTWARSRPDGALFPDEPDASGHISGNFSKWYSRNLRGKWGVRDRRVKFHSWRHTFADMCRIASVTTDVRMAIMGHSEGGTAGTYGSGCLPSRILSEGIAKLRLLD